MRVESTAVDAHGQLIRRGRALEYLTLGWNLAEAVVAITAGVLAGSSALLGFGLDSVIESTSGAVLLWRLRAGPEGERREQLALKFVGVSFLLLAAYVAWEAGSTLWFHKVPDDSVVGMVLAAVSLIVMPILARAKRKVAAGLGSGALQADSRQTDLCAVLSAILLGGLALNWLFGWWWADPVAALIMVPLIALEGVRALQGKHCDDCAPVVR